MVHIGCFSGGKDSTALMLWMRENIGVPGKDWTPVFCDTNWEHPITYAYIQEINATVLNGSLVTLKSEKYPGGFVQLCAERHAIPAVKSRFCTGELKVFPLHAYYKSLDDGEVFSYQGIRANESASRACMTEDEFVNDAGGYTIMRPLLSWTAADCFAIMERTSVKPNPLYLLGASRVGCWPCIMTGLAELKRTLSFFPEVKQRLIDLEKFVNESDARGVRKWQATFFASGTIPDRFCSISGMTERGTIAYVPTAEDVFRYIESVDENQLPLLPARSCMSVYNLCE